MSILNVNKINPVGSGSTITIAGIASVTGNISVGGSITGEHHGDASNLTSIPAGNLTGTVADARISTLTASKLTGSLPAISGANLTGLSAGVTMANSWNCSSGFNYQAQTDITSWSEDTAGKIGTGMSNSSGIFTFPSTGIYRVRFSNSTYNIGAAANRYVGAFVYWSTNSGGSYTILREQYGHINNDNACTTTVVTSNYLNVSNTSTTRVKFSVAAENNSTLNGGYYGTFVEFIRLGDT